MFLRASPVALLQLRPSRAYMSIWWCSRALHNQYEHLLGRLVNFIDIAAAAAVGILADR